MTDPRPTRRVDPVVVGAFGALLVYWSTFIHATSFTIRDTRYFCLLDDAMISMRYARHIAAGIGPVWNPGQAPVEGFTNPLWTLLMAVFHLLPVSAPHLSLLVQLSGLVCLAATLMICVELLAVLSDGRAGRSAQIGFLAVAGLYAPLLNWALQGSEVSLVAMFLALSLRSCFRAVDSVRFTWAPHVIAATVSLVRLDAIVPAFAISCWIALAQPRWRSKHIKAAVVIAGGAMAGQTLLRLLVFGMWLPNTYYLKMTGFPISDRITRGVLVTWLDVRSLGAAIIAAIPGLRGNNKKLAVLAVIGATFAYSAYVGGDAWEWWGGANRYMAVATPLLFVLSLSGIAHVVKATQLPAFTSAIAAGLVCVSINMFAEGRGLRVVLLREPPLHVLDNHLTVSLGEGIARCTPTSARLAVDWAGAIPYFSQRYTIDLLAKSDPKVAREPMKVTDSPGGYRFWPGHQKWDYQYSIAELRPDIVLILIRGLGFSDRARPFLADYEVGARALGGIVALRRNPGTDTSVVLKCLDSQIPKTLHGNAWRLLGNQ